MATAPLITTEPISQFIEAGDTATFSLVATGDPVLSYQWRKYVDESPVDLIDGGKISGSTSDTLQISNSQVAEALNYDCIVANGIPTDATSIIASLLIGNYPSWIASYPSISSIGAKTIDFKVKVNKAATAFFVAVLHGSASPSSAQVRQGLDGSGNPVADGLKGYASLGSVNERTVTITDLTVDTEYDVYFVADSAGYLQPLPTMLYVRTALTSLNTEYSMGNQLPMLVDGSKVGITVTSDNPQVMMSEFDGDVFLLPKYNFSQNKSLIFRLFCYDVKSNVPFKVIISGAFGGTQCVRNNANEFGLTWKVGKWDEIKDGDATITIVSNSPTSIKCVCGLLVSPK